MILVSWTSVKRELSRSMVIFLQIYTIPSDVYKLIGILLYHIQQSKAKLWTPGLNASRNGYQKNEFALLHCQSATGEFATPQSVGNSDNEY